MSKSWVICKVPFFFAFSFVLHELYSDFLSVVQPESGDQRSGFQNWDAEVSTAGSLEEGGVYTRAKERSCVFESVRGDDGLMMD